MNINQGEKAMRMRVMAMVCGLFAGAVHPATPIPTTATFPVSATVSSGCVVAGNPSQTSGVGFGMLDFGTHPAVIGSSANASITMGGGSMAQVQCTPGVAVTMTIDGGLNAVGSQRRMKLAPNYYLPYTLYSSAGGSSPILPGVGISVNAGSSAFSLPVHGIAVSPGTGLPAGKYTDTVQVVFSW